MKKLFISLTLVILSACGSSGVSDVANSATYENDLFSISYPGNWENIENLNNAPSGAIAVFRSPKSSEGIFSNLSITKDDIGSGISAIKFAKINAETLPSVLINFQSVNQEGVNIAGIDTVIFNFLGRESADSQDREYSQTYLVQNGQGFVLTLIYPISLSASEKKDLKSFFYTFSFK